MEIRHYWQHFLSGNRMCILLIWSFFLNVLLAEQSKLIIHPLHQTGTATEYIQTVSQQELANCYSGPEKVDIVRCCRNNPYLSWWCRSIVSYCLQSHDLQGCPDCFNSSDKEYCCILNPKHPICKSNGGCKLAADVAACCLVPYDPYCHLVSRRCHWVIEDPVCPKKCSNSTAHYHCCELSPKSEGCPVGCKTPNEQIIKCCDPRNYDPHSSCFSGCYWNPNDSSCGYCSTYLDKFACCHRYPADSICSKVIDCESYSDKTLCVFGHNFDRHFRDWMTCHDRPGHQACPQDCSTTVMRYGCCGLNPNAKGCPSDCEKELDVSSCCHINPHFAHCQKILKTCWNSSLDQICPDCNVTKSLFFPDYCCNFNPTHQNERCRSASCKYSSNVAYCCYDRQYSIECQDVISTCRVTPEDPKCPTECNYNHDYQFGRKEYYFCCSLNPKARGCTTDCEEDRDVTECCRFNPSYNRCLAIKARCNGSSADPICPDCSDAFDRLYCCELLNPNHTVCPAYKDCKSVPDVAACCKVNPSTNHCTYIKKICPTMPTDPSCPQDCSRSSETNFCCSINPMALGCSKDCQKVNDVVNCCKNFPQNHFCKEIKDTCANSSKDPICPNCYSTSDVNTCCLLNPSHLVCPSNCKPGR